MPTDEGEDSSPPAPEHFYLTVRLDARVFAMGARTGDSDEDSDEHGHGVTLTKSIDMDLTEVSQAEFTRLMSYNPSFFPTCGDDCPVEQVSWSEAAAYTNARSAEDGLLPCYRCTGEGVDVECETAGNPYLCPGWRLPTEAEWESATYCTTHPTTIYAGSDDVDEVAWYDLNSDGETHPGALKKESSCGVFDLSGNVWEWVNDWYDEDYYYESPDEDPVGPETGIFRSVRGGSYSGDAANTRATNRGYFDPAGRIDYLGFRAVRSVP